MPDEEQQSEKASSPAPSSAGATNNENRELSDTELIRIETHKSQQHATVGSTTGKPCPREKWLVMGGGKPIPANMENPDDYIVEFDGSHDPIHPFNWKLRKK